MASEGKDILFAGATRPSLVWGVTYETIIFVSLLPVCFFSLQIAFGYCLYMFLYTALAT